MLPICFSRSTDTFLYLEPPPHTHITLSYLIMLPLISMAESFVPLRCLQSPQTSFSLWHVVAADLGFPPLARVPNSLGVALFPGLLCVRPCSLSPLNDPRPVLSQDLPSAIPITLCGVLPICGSINTILSGFFECGDIQRRNILTVRTAIHKYVS